LPDEEDRHVAKKLPFMHPGDVLREEFLVPLELADIQIRDGALIVTPVDVAPSYDIDALVALVKPENLHGEIDTGGAVGNEVG
jgi:antitoxin component of MazEF toxin-antitoxin module